MRYPALRTVSIIYKLLGLIIGLVGIVSCVFAVASGQRWLDEMAALGMTITADNRITVGLIPIFFLLLGLVAAVSCYAAGEFIKLMIDVEANTRGMYRQGQQDRAAPRQRDLWAEP